MAVVSLGRIARRAGVSTSTVSVILNRKEGIPVASNTREKVVKIAKDMGYQRQAIARAVLSPLRHIGIAVQDLNTAYETFTALIFQGVQQRLGDMGYSALFRCVDSPAAIYDKGEAQAVAISVAAAEGIIDSFRSRLIDGVVLDKQHFYDVAVRRMFTAGVPMVMVNGGRLSEGGCPIPSVTIDDRKAGRLATSHLLELRHQRIALISRPFAQGSHAHMSTPVLEFRRGYEEALRQSGHEPDESLWAEGDMLDKAATVAAVERVMAAANPPTALLAGDDQLAAMAINALRHRGLRVPEDVSVMGCGNLSLVERLIEPGLTTINLPLLDNGIRAASMLIRAVEGGSVEEPQVVLAPELVIRQTTAPR